MLPLEFKLKAICKERLFSAIGANTLFDEISNAIDKSDGTTFEVLINFEGISLVSTSFIGRFHEHMNELKKNHTIKFKLTNLKPEIKRQFMKNDTSAGTP